MAATKTKNGARNGGEPVNKITGADRARREDLILKMLRVGVPRSTAVEAGEISVPTFHKWIKKDENEFAARVAAAEADAEYSLVSKIVKQAGYSWRAAAWILERRWPEHWATLSERKRANDDGDEDEPENPLAEFDELAERRVKSA